MGFSLLDGILRRVLELLDKFIFVNANFLESLTELFEVSMILFEISYPNISAMLYFSYTEKSFYQKKSTKPN